MGIEKEILKNLNLCATLMSDPVILRSHPNLVADQFQTVRTSIETLGVFLRPRPQEDSCGCHAKGWMDVSIITEGIGKMVTKLLAVHTGVIRTTSFPCIVEDELRFEGPTGDNNTVREIKESSCMGAIVLLYYYLYWYLFLIRMNQRIDPNYCTESQLNIGRLIEGLPRAHAFLEFRHLGSAFRKTTDGGNTIARIDALKNSSVMNQFMFTSVDTKLPAGNIRKTVLVAVYRRALDTNIRVQDVEDSSIEFPPHLKEKSSSKIFDIVTVNAIVRGYALMGGMGSTFERNNPLQKWKDMHQPVQVYGVKSDGKGSKLKGQIARILSKPPYVNDMAEFRENATVACIYDHCSALLMMDVCRSFEKLAEVVSALSKPNSDETNIFIYIHGFLQQLAGYSADATGMTKHLELKMRLEVDHLEEECLTFTSKSDSMLSINEETDVFQKASRNQKTALWLDDFRNTYPTRMTGVNDDVNRACFLFDYALKRDNECRTVKWMEIIQSELIKYTQDANAYDFCPAYALAIIASFTRNAWMVAHGTHSVQTLTHRLIATPGFRNLSLTMDVSLNFYLTDQRNDSDAMKRHHKVDLASILSIAELGSFGSLMFPPLYNKVFPSDPLSADIKKLKESFQAAVKDHAVSFTDIAAYAANQKRILDALTMAAKDFTRYPALAWPVKYIDAADNSEKTNLGSFDIVREQRRQAVEHADVETLIKKLKEQESKHRESLDNLTIQARAQIQAEAARLYQETVDRIAAARPVVPA